MTTQLLTPATALMGETGPILLRKVAHALGIRLEEREGTGPDGRVMLADLNPSPSNSTERPMTAPAALDAVAERQPREPSPFSLNATVRCDALLELRARINAARPAGTEKIGLTGMLLKAWALALHAEAAPPDVEIIHFGLIVPGERGRVTIVVPDVTTHSLSTISLEMRSLTQVASLRAHPPTSARTVASIINLGMFGVEVGMLNAGPHGMILGIGAIGERVTMRSGEAFSEQVATVSGSFDPRIVDERTALRVLAGFRSLIEQPLLLLS